MPEFRLPFYAAGLCWESAFSFMRTKKRVRRGQMRSFRMIRTEEIAAGFDGEYKKGGPSMALLFGYKSFSPENSTSSGSLAWLMYWRDSRSLCSISAISARS